MRPTAVDDDGLMDRLREAFADKLYLTRAELAPVLRMTVKTLGRCEQAGDITGRRKGAGRTKPRRVYTFEDVVKAKFLKQQETAACPSISPRARRSTFSTSGGEVVAFSDRLVKRQNARP